MPSSQWRPRFTAAAVSGDSVCVVSNVVWAPTPAMCPASRMMRCSQASFHGLPANDVTWCATSAGDWPVVVTGADDLLLQAHLLDDDGPSDSWRDHTIPLHGHLCTIRAVTSCAVPASWHAVADSPRSLLVSAGGRQTVLVWAVSGTVTVPRFAVACSAVRENGDLDQRILSVSTLTVVLRHG
jgi:hypothetical protein